MKLVILAACCLLLYGSQASAAVLPAQLRCEFRPDPLGVDIDPAAPELGTHRERPRRARLVSNGLSSQAASSPALLDKGEGDSLEFRSGEVRPKRACSLRREAAPVSAAGVLARARAGPERQAVGLEPPGRWTMGLLHPQDWQPARWIGAPARGREATGDGKPYETVLLRHEFAVKPGLRRAVAFVCGLGQYE